MKLKLVATGQAVFAGYVCRQTSFTFSGMPPEECALFYMTGLDWDAHLGKFTQHTRFGRFDDTFDFRETYTGDAVQWTHYWITLHPVPFGNARTSEVSEREFDQ